MAEIRGILFDKDGVFVDFEKTWTPVLKAAAHEIAAGEHSARERLLHVAGLDPASDRFLPGSIWAAGHADDLVEAWLPMAGGRSRQQLFDLVGTHCVEAKPHPVLGHDEQRRIFNQLKQHGLKLGVATNDMEASAKATVAHFGLSDVFDIVLGYDSVANPKPAGDPVVAFSGHVGLQPGVVMMVGDNTHDMHCGRAGGAGVCVGVLSGNSTHAELSALADHVIDDISLLQCLLARLRG
jgi:phosphoglycolate phosphatase